MGRGRAKAKQTKVARQLKYGGPVTDLERLQAELAGASSSDADAQSDGQDEYEAYDDDLYAKYADEAEVEDADGDDEYPHGR